MTECTTEHHGLSKSITSSEQMMHPLQIYVDQLIGKYKSCHEGDVATYIPELGLADPNWFAVAITTVDGHTYFAGDSLQTFSIQSISKPFVYGLALQDVGLDTVMRHVGVEPSGDTFNSISLDPQTGRPLNPMINAGAIATSEMVMAENSDHRFERILQTFSKLAGRKLQLDESVYQSESRTGYRNRAIANLLRNSDMIHNDPDSTVECYFKQCSILTSCQDLAVMAGTLAAAGVCPLNGEKVFSSSVVSSVLSIMSSCGMYDFAGEWICHVGMPAKSGVAGGIIGVMPGQFGIAVFSPRLDTHGNSIRGINVFKDIAATLGLHLFNRSSQPRTFIRTRYDASHITSKQLRPKFQTRILQALGKSIGVWNLQGFLHAYAIEWVIHEVLKMIQDKNYLIFDMHRVIGLAPAAADLLVKFANESIAQGKYVLFTHCDRHFVLTQAAEKLSGNQDTPQLHWMADADSALQWCEDHLLRLNDALEIPDQVEIKDFEIVKSMTPAQLQTLRTYLKGFSKQKNQVLIHEGGEVDGLYFLTLGYVNITIEGDHGKPIRVATCSPMMSFGEMALFDRSPRSATVRASTHVQYYVLSMEAFAQLRTENSQIAFILMDNIMSGFSDKLRHANDEINSLNG